MALKDLFTRAKFSTVKPEEKGGDADVPEGMFEKCPKCQKSIFTDKIEENLYVCPECGHHFRISAKKRLDMTFSNFEPMFENLRTVNPLDFKGYDEKIAGLQEKTGITEAVTVGTGYLAGCKVACGAMDSNFMMASMGSVVGERIARIVEYAAENNLPLILFICSGGARMQEGILSLMQMAKVSAALTKLSQSGNPYFAVLTDPTTGGVTASFAMLGDVIISEPGALIGFAGRRVIEGTIGQTLPENFQTAEFLLEHGFIDLITDRRDMIETLTRLLKFHNVGGQAE